MSSGRLHTGFGTSCITWPDIYAWSQLKGFNLKLWEIEAIREIDRAYIKVMSEDS